MIENWRRCLLVLATLAAAGAPAVGEAPVSPPPQPTPWALELSTFYQALDNGYGDWQGAGVRLSYTSPRVSPFVGLSYQHRDAGSQESFGVGSYVTLDSHSYMIVGFSSAPSGDVVLF